MTLILFCIITIIFTIFFGVYKKYALFKTKKYFRFIFLTNIILSFISGILNGTFYSHGFDIPWWIFSFVFFLIILTTSIFVIVIFKFLKNEKK